MFTLLAVLLLVVALVSYIWGKVKKEKDHQTPSKPFPKFPFPGKPYTYVLVAIAMFMINGLFFWNNSGTITSVQYPWGGDKMIATQGLKVKAWGKTIPISYEISIQDKILKTNSDGEIEKISGSSDGIYNRVAKKWEFSDAIKADIATAIVIEIVTEDEEAFLNMADRNRSEAKLIYGRVLPNIDAALKNTCKLMDAQDYISGAASDFDRYFRDQLENGMYQVEEYYDDDVLPEIIGDTTTVRKIDNNNGASSKQKKYKIKLDDQGNEVRDNSSNSLSQYGIKFIQAQVTSIDWEGSFDTRLDRQKEEVALTQLEKQAAERLYYTTQKEIALGESNKATERALLEKEQIKLTIAAETEAKVAVQNRIAEVEKLEVAKLQAKSKKVAADATYYENLKRVQAGLTPQERATLDEQMNRDKWSHIGKMKFDGVYMMGGSQGKGNDGILSALLGAEVAKGMKQKK